MNVSGFLLQASLREAEQVLREEASLVVSPEEFAWIASLIDAATPAPRLKDALA